MKKISNKCHNFEDKCHNSKCYSRLTLPQTSTVTILSQFPSANIALVAPNGEHVLIPDHFHRSFLNMAFLHMYLVILTISASITAFTAFLAALSQGLSLRGSGKGRQILFQIPKFPFYRHNLHNIIITAL